MRESETTDPLSALEALVRESMPLQTLLSNGIGRHLQRIEKLNQATAEEEPVITEDVFAFQELQKAVDSGFGGFQTRDVVWRRSQARLNFCNQNDVSPSDPSMLQLTDSNGKPRMVEEYVVQIEQRGALSAVHRPDRFSGYSRSAEQVAGTGGFQVSAFNQMVGFNPRTERVQWQPQVGVSVQVLDNGEVTALPQKYTGRLPYSAEPQDLSGQLPGMGTELFKALKSIFG